MHKSVLVIASVVGVVVIAFAILLNVLGQADLSTTAENGAVAECAPVESVAPHVDASGAAVSDGVDCAVPVRRGKPGEAPKG